MKPSSANCEVGPKLGGFNRFAHALKAKRHVSSLISSLIIHGVLFLVLAVWFFPVIAESWRTPIDATVSQQEEATDLKDIESAFELDASDASPYQTIVEGLDSLRAQFSAQPVAQTAVLKTRLPSGAVEVDFPSVNEMTDAELTQRIELPMTSMAIHEHRGETRVAEADSAGQISSGLTGQLNSIAHDGDSLIVWLLDQSLSMQKDLKVLSEGLKETLVAIEADKTHRMIHYVVAFGDSVNVIQDATSKGKKVASAIYNMPPSTSGVENTFQATEWAIINLFGNRKWLGRPKQMLLVIWTDESGDDILRLEDTIRLCRQANVRVDIIGPSAVLGSQQGYSKFLHPEDNRVYYLPVTRGPDTAFREKPYLPYWHRGVPWDYDESIRGPFQGTSPQWYGGSDMKSMLSGFSPYALTRLAKETGGVYTLFDRPGDRAPFSQQSIQNYRPDYRHIAEIDAENRLYPLRMAIQGVAEVTWKEYFSPPQLAFRPQYGGQPSSEFAIILFREMKEEIARCEMLVHRIERCQALFESINVDEARTSDRSHRWRAWTDLTVGRLLTLGVRLREYLLTLEALAANEFALMSPQTNSISLVPSGILRGGEPSALVAAKAKTFLERCVEENRGTPWQYLAERELQHPVGLQIVQSHVPVPPRSSAPAPIPQKRVVLPNL